MINFDYADNALAATLADGKQIANAIQASKTFGSEKTWMERSFVADTGALSKSRVQARKIPLANTSPNQLALYLVTVRTEVNVTGTPMETLTEQHLVELGIP